MSGSYGQFCPISMASEVLCARWTPLLLRELLCGSTRFNDLRRGLPRMSPSLLSKRLGELETAGVIHSVKGAHGVKEYRLTQAGEELRPLVMGIGAWGQRWVESEISLNNLDPQLLIWDMHRGLNIDPLPERRVCLQFVFGDLPVTRQNYWLLVDPQSGVEACYSDPGYEVDLFSESSLRTMTAIWMGLDTVQKAVKDGRLNLTGPREIAARMQEWLGFSPFAQQERMVG
ncbi:transcriptional regulator [Roseovarius sp. A46]|uniref:winged helix-turn-helix transcriptional regulator n=1 Tax=Roseovarius sp. A46 TaxID=2109331 RepID=UPI00101247DA|nr:helix-turn-helix domain-containing protein [Roseovarius sp. A46]RXV64646.1 transcriptional regulator [Roseovarius sp. A46]